MEAAGDLKSPVRTGVPVRLRSPAPFKEGKMVDFGIFVIAVAVVAIGGYFIGHNACNEKWKGGLEDKVNELLHVEMQKISDLYQEAYRNVLQDLLSMKEELEKENGQK